MRPKINKGVWTAIVTPFHSDGSIDWESFANLVQNQVNAGISGIVVSGTTGEAPTLSVQEKVDLVRECRKLVGSKCQIMIGGGGNDTAASVDLSKRGIDAGADSVLVVTPPYNKPSVAGLVAHFSQIATAVGVPVCLYHVPGRTAQRLSAQAMAQICNIEHVCAIKEASGDIQLFQQTVNAVGDQTICLSGDDFTYLASLAVGAEGCISVASNLYPKAMVVLTKAMEAGDLKKAKAINKVLYPVYEALFCETNPAPIKYALAYAKLIKHDHLRLPLVSVQAESAVLLRKCMDDAAIKLRDLI